MRICDFKPGLKNVSFTAIIVEPGMLQLRRCRATRDARARTGTRREGLTVYRVADATGSVLLATFAGTALVEARAGAPALAVLATAVALYAATGWTS